MSEHEDGPRHDDPGLPGEPGLPGRPNPRDRPDDPAGTKPKVDPDALLPQRREPLLPPAPPEDAGGDGEEVAGEGALLPERIAAAGSPAPAARAVEAPHAPRFQFLLGALVTLGAAAVAAVVVLALGGGPSGEPGPTWSRWHPDGDDATAEIADHVGREYHLASGEQLVVVTGGPLEVAGLPLTIALRQPADEGGDISLVDGKGVLYRLCGLGPRCAIATGKASTERHLLLRREALELALYTFRYTDADNVVAFLPPRRGKEPTQAIYFRRSDVTSEVDRPLAATLTRTAPLPNTVDRSPDAAFVDRITLQRLYQFSLTQANQDDRAFLVLQPLG